MSTIGLSHNVNKETFITYSNVSDTSVHISQAQKHSLLLLYASACTALQLKFGLPGLHGFGGDLGSVYKYLGLLSWFLCLSISEQKMTDEKLQAFPKHSQLRNSRDPDTQW